MSWMGCSCAYRLPRPDPPARFRPAWPPLGPAQSPNSLTKPANVGSPRSGRRARGVAAGRPLSGPLLQCRHRSADGNTHKTVEVPEDLNKIPTDDATAGGGNPLDGRPPKDRPSPNDRVRPGRDQVFVEAPRLHLDPRDLVTDPQVERGRRSGVVKPLENKSVRYRGPRPGS